MRCQRTSTRNSSNTKKETAVIEPSLPITTIDKLQPSCGIDTKPSISNLSIEVTQMMLGCGMTIESLSSQKGLKEVKNI